MALWTYTAVALFLTFQCAYGNGVSLDNNPKVIQTILTQVMTMQCSINDTGAVNDLRFVTSLVVTRNGQEVASITPFSPAVALQDLTSLNVTGHVSMANGAEGVLLLKWTYPDAAQSGNYSCEVNGVNTVGHPVAYSTIVTVPVRQPTLDDITLHVRDQEILINQQTLDNINLKLDNKNQEAAINTLLDDMKIQKETTSNMRTQNLLMNSKLDEILTVLDETRHVENGTLVYGQSSSWTDVGDYMEKNITATFDFPYGKPPVVHFTPVHVDNYNSNSNFQYSLKYWMDLVHVNGTEFTLSVRTEGVSTSYLYFNQFDVDWISIGNPDA